MALNTLAAYSKRGARRATYRLRPLPNFLIIGGIRGGTTSLIRYLAEHPSVVTSATKEVHYYDWNFHHGEAWYRSWFPTGPAAQRAIGESSPAYLMDPAVPERVRASLPDVRLILLLRNPVERAHSHYRLRRGKAHEKAETFEDALQDEPRRMKAADGAANAQAGARLDCYFHHGDYATGLERWLHHVDREQILAMDSARFYSDPSAAYQKVLGFLELSPHDLGQYPVHNAAALQPIDPKTRAALADRYDKPNQDLYSLIGEDWGWH